MLSGILGEILRWFVVYSSVTLIIWWTGIVLFFKTYSVALSPVHTTKFFLPICPWEGALLKNWSCQLLKKASCHGKHVSFGRTHRQVKLIKEKLIKKNLVRKTWSCVWNICFRSEEISLSSHWTLNTLKLSLQIKKTSQTWPAWKPLYVSVSCPLLSFGTISRTLVQTGWQILTRFTEIL